MPLVVTGQFSSKTNYLGLLASMAAIVFGTVTAVFMLGPLLVDMSQDWDTTVPVVAQLVSLSAIGWALTGPLVGPFSDTYGRKPVLLLGASLVVVGSLGTALAWSFPVAAVFRVLAGMGGGMIPPTCVALIGDVFPEKRRGMSVGAITMQPGLGAVLGTPAATLLADFVGWRSSFLMAGGITFLAGVVFFLVCPHYRDRTATLDFVRRLRQVVSLPLTWSLAAATITYRIGYGTITIFFPPFLKTTYELRTAEVALPVAIVAVGTTLGSLTGGWLSSRRRRLLLAAVAMLTATVVSLGTFLSEVPMWNSVIVASLMMTLLFIAFPIIMTIAAEVGGSSRGTLLGVLVSGNQGGTALGIATGGLLVAQVGYRALSFELASAALIGSLLLGLVVQERTIAAARQRFSLPPN